MIRFYIQKKFKKSEIMYTLLMLYRERFALFTDYICQNELLSLFENCEQFTSASLVKPSSAEMLICWAVHIHTYIHNQMKNDPRSCDRNFYNCVKKPEKNSGLQRGLNPWPRDTGATLYQLSYEATDVGSRSISYASFTYIHTYIHTYINFIFSRI